MDTCLPTTTADFDSEIDYKKRRAVRRPLDVPTGLSDRADYRIEVNVRNVSACGFMAECPTVVPIGSRVTLDVPGLGPVDAQVRWQTGSRMGGMFLDPIHLGRCEWTAERADSRLPASAPPATR